MSTLAIALALAGAAAPAQSTDAVLRSYAACAVKRDDAVMMAMLDAWDENGYRTAARNFSENARCIVSDEAATAVTVSVFNQDRGKLRGIVAETLVKRSNTARRLAPVPRAPAYSAPWFALTSRVTAIDEMAVCVAAIDPAGVLALLSTQPGSAAQKQAFGALTPSLGTCLAKGYQLDTKPAALRAALAEALYHRDRAEAVK